MQVRILLFAGLREAAGARELCLELPGPCTVQELRAALAAAHPKLAGLVERAAVAVNEEYRDASHRIEPGDVVALIPPVSGG